MKKISHYFVLRFLVLLSMLLILNGRIYAQINEGGTPKGFTEVKINAISELPFILLPSFDVAAYLKEDSIDNLNLARSFRFAKGFDVSYSFNNSGIWETLDNGD